MNWKIRVKRLLFLVAGLAVFCAAFLTYVCIDLKRHLRLSNHHNVAYMSAEEAFIAVKSYQKDCGQTPTTEQGLKALLFRPSIEPACPKWNGPYGLPYLIVDPWNEPYIYESDGKHFVIRSLGSDKKEGGVGQDEDIVFDSADAAWYEKRHR